LIKNGNGSLIGAIRDGKYKLHSDSEGNLELYDLEKDPGETTDLSHLYLIETLDLYGQMFVSYSILSMYNL